MKYLIAYLYGEVVGKWEILPGYIHGNQYWRLMSKEEVEKMMAGHLKEMNGKAHGCMHIVLKKISEIIEEGDYLIINTTKRRWSVIIPSSYHHCIPRVPYWSQKTAQKKIKELKKTNQPFIIVKRIPFDIKAKIRR